MKLLLFGANGQVGQELRRSLLPLGDITTFDQSAADFENPECIRLIASKHGADIIVNAAAYTAVDNA